MKRMVVAPITIDTNQRLDPIPAILLVPEDDAETVEKWMKDVPRLREALAFAASVIKSGEEWTQTCEEVIGKLLEETR